MDWHRLQTRLALALVLAVAGSAPSLAAQLASGQPDVRPTVPPTEYSYIAAQEAVWNYQTCAGRDRLATYQALVAELGSIESLARSKGLGPTLQRVREEHNRLLAISSRMLRRCAGGPSAALARARQAIAAFRTWVQDAPPHTLTQAEIETAATQEIFAVDDGYGAAVLNRDEAALRRILDDTFAFDRGDGTTTDIGGLIATLRGLNLISHRMTARTVVIRDGVRIVTGSVELASASATQSVVSRHPYTATYHCRSGTWRMVALQMSLERP